MKLDGYKHKSSLKGNFIFSKVIKMDEVSANAALKNKIKKYIIEA